MLPSEIALEVKTTPPSTSEEVEDRLQEVLSSLATLPPLALTTDDVRHSLSLHQRPVVLPSQSPRAQEEEWSVGLRLIGWLMGSSPTTDSLLSPFALHSLATQASVFYEAPREDDPSPDIGRRRLYTTTCLLLCCRALAQCPSRVTTRPRRWKSCLLETLRLFQQHKEDNVRDESLVRDVVAASLWVRRALPLDNDDNNGSSLRWVAGWQCAMVGLLGASASQRLLEDDAPPLQNTGEQLCQDLDAVMEGQFHAMLRASYFQEGEIEKDVVSSVERSIAFWWSGLVGEDDRDSIALVEVTKDDLGLAALSCLWLDWKKRPQVWTGAYLWFLLFPNVSVLLNTNESIRAQCQGFSLLRHLLSLVPAALLPTPSAQRPNYPVGTLQLLANRIVASAVSRERPNEVPQSSLLPDGTQAFDLMKQLLARYAACDQVHFVEELHAQCPHQGLKSKLLDLLRVVITWTDPKGLWKVWTFLDSRLQSLEAYIRIDEVRKRPQIADPQELVLETEDFVAVMNLLRLWVMVKKTIPEIPDFAARLDSVLDALSYTLASFQSVDSFRLGLLESAVQFVQEEIQRGIETAK
jgi:hypothetical protein